MTYQTEGRRSCGLTNGQDYFVIRLDNDTIRLAATAQNATANPPVPISLDAKDVAATVRHSLRLPGEIADPGPG